MPDLLRDGVRLHYAEAGAGEPPVVLVHGWCCDHSYMAPQAEHLSLHHRVVSLDLRGHGASDRPQQDDSIGGFADDVAWTCAALGVTNPVVVGHSMGGAIALELAARHADGPSGIVLLDPAPITPPPHIAGMLPPLHHALRSPGYVEAARQFLDGFLFLPTDDHGLKERVIGQMTSAPQHVLASAFEGIGAWDAEAAARSCRVPALVIVAGDVPYDLTRLRELMPEVHIGRTVGAGHLIQLLVPEQVNAIIDRFLRVAVPGAVPA